jgi:hypothetical protein
MWRSIHPSAQKKNSANFAIIRFSKVATLRSSYFSEVHTILSRLSERGESMDISPVSRGRHYSGLAGTTLPASGPPALMRAPSDELEMNLLSAGPTPKLYSPHCVEEEFSEVRPASSAHIWSLMSTMTKARPPGYDEGAYRAPRGEEP